MNQSQNPQLSFPEVRIVEASAGSGKTYALAKRYIQLLINAKISSKQIPLSNILAITFTHKATREMRERILELLKKIAFKTFNSPSEKKDLLGALDLEEDQAAKRANAVLDYIIEHYNFFQVKNIDSFINVILSSCATVLNLSANFRIKENYTAYVSYALDECIDASAKNKKTAQIFQKFLNQYIFLENRTGWFPKNDVLDILSGLFSQSNIYGGTFERFEVANKGLITLREHILNILKSILKQKPEGMDKRFLNITLKNFVDKNKQGFNVADLNKKAFMSETLPMNKGYEVLPELALRWRDFRKSVIELCEKEALALFNCYIDIFQNVYAYFREYARKDDVVFMEELNKQARVLFIEGNLSVPELYYRLANRFRHFLIDEFQDTSSLQWHNLFLMVEDALSAGGSLFYVGDKKQAIYRFRGGDVGLFDRIKTDFKKFNINDKFPLKVNYRSQKEIVEFNNEIFSKDNLRRFLLKQQEVEKDSLCYSSADEIEEVLSVFSDSKQKYKPEKQHGYVSVTHVEYFEKEDRDELIRIKLIDALQELKARFPLKSIAILCRSNQEIELVTGWLTREKINAESERTLNITNNTLIQELIAFLKFLNSPLDTISFCTFISGDIFQKVSGKTGEQIADFILEFNNKKSKASGYLYRCFREQFPQLWDKYIGEFFKSVGFVPLYELLVSVMDKLCLFDNFNAYQGFFMRLLELVREQEEENPDIASFLEFLDSAQEKHLFINFSNEFAVKVMTIHKAKGLGFAVVLVPFLELNIRELGTRTKKVRAPYVVYAKENDGLFGLLRLDRKYAQFSSKIRDVYRREYVKSLIDELNAIYVTFTRAQNELYLFIPFLQSRTNNAAQFLIPENIIERGKQVTYDRKEVVQTQASMPIPVPKYQDWIALLKEEFQENAQLENRTNIKNGEILHALLEQVGNLKNITLQKKNTFLKGLKQKLERENPGIGDAAEYIKIVDTMISSRNLKKFFYHVDDVKIHREIEFVDKFGIARRIDRLLIKEDEIWIVDYKSSQEKKAEHVKQIREYKTIVACVYKKKKVRGFLIYMDTVEAEEI